MCVYMCTCVKHILHCMFGCWLKVCVCVSVCDWKYVKSDKGGSKKKMDIQKDGKIYFQQTYEYFW